MRTKGRVLTIARQLAGMLLLCASCGSSAATQSAGKTCHLPFHSEPLRCHQIDVPQDYDEPSGARLSLHVAIAPAFRENARPDPLFVLAGGPGQAGSDIVPLIEHAFRRVRATRDIVLIDQRGTGLSGKLVCADVPELDTLDEQTLERVLIDCLRALNKPFEHYTTANAARDLDEIRAALGYETINLWGGSYGTRLAQAYARAFPNRVRSLIMDAVASPQQILGVWGEDAQRALDGAFSRCSADPRCSEAFPDLKGEFAALTERVKASEVKLDFLHPRTASPTQLTLPVASYLETVRTSLYSAEGAARLPYVLHQAHRGQWRPFLALMYSQTDWSLDAMAYGLTLAVVCAEDMPRLTPQIIAEERRASFLEAMHVETWPQICRELNVPVVQYQAPTAIDAPALLLSGGLDPVTPPSRAEQAAASIPKAQHLIAPHVGHGVSHLGCAPRLLRQFLDNPSATLDGKCLDEIAAPQFMINAAGAQP